MCISCLHFKTTVSLNITKRLHFLQLSFLIYLIRNLMQQGYYHDHEYGRRWTIARKLAEFSRLKIRSCVVTCHKIHKYHNIYNLGNSIHLCKLTEVKRKQITSFPILCWQLPFPFRSHVPLVTYSCHKMTNEWHWHTPQSSLSISPHYQGCGQGCVPVRTEGPYLKSPALESWCLERDAWPRQPGDASACA